MPAYKGPHNASLASSATLKLEHRVSPPPPPEKLLQIVLVGQPELESKISRPELRQLKQRIAVQCRLERLDDEEVGPFINYRLNVVGYKGHQLFTPDAVQEIAYYSKGYPWLINILCDNALLIAYATSQKSVTGEIIEEAANDLRFEWRGRITTCPWRISAFVQ